MTEYAQSSFDVEAYMSKRPRYPEHLYNLLREYRQNALEITTTKKTLLDLGCGPGMASWPLLQQFDDVIGVDPGEAMIERARDAYSSIRASTSPSNTTIAQARFEVAHVEQLHTLGIAPASVDCVIAATAAHWFAMAETYGQLAHVMRSGATLAMWTYDLAYPPAHASTAPMVMNFAYEDMKGFVDVQACQTIRSLYAELALPNDMQDWTDVQYYAYPNSGRSGGYLPVIPCTAGMAQRVPSSTSTTESGLTIHWDAQLHTRDLVSWQDLKAAKRTNSSYHNWRLQHPHVGLAEDIAAKQVDALRRQVLIDRKLGIGTGTADGEDDDLIGVIRPMGLLLMRRR